MTISQIKKDLCDHLGDNVLIKYNLGRNKYEKYTATVKEVYDYVFLVECNNKLNIEIKSFSYIDVITNTVKIDY